MDVILGREAEAVLRAAAATARVPPLEGFLLGHRRGPVFYVERLLPFGPALDMSEDDVRAAGKAMGGAILGFFTLRPGASRRERVRRAAYCGTLFAQGVRPRRGGRVRLRMYRVDYEGGFVLKPLTVKDGG